MSEADILRLFERIEASAPFTVPPGELSVAVLQDEAHCQLHELWLGDPSPTDVITFEGDPKMDFAGEIVVNASQARREAHRHGNTIAQELELYLVHGWLHLAGLNDIRAEDAAQMRKAEQLVLSCLRNVS